MRRFFVKNLLFVITINLLVKPVWIFMIDRTVQNRVGHAAYGTYQALLSLGVIFQILLDFGLTFYNTRIITEDPKKMQAVFPAMLSARLLFILVYTAIVLTAGWLFGYRSWELGLLGGVLLTQALNSLMLFLRSNVSALHKFKADGLLSVADRLMMIVICGALLFNPVTAPHFRVGWFVWAQVCCYILAIALAFGVLKKISGIKLRFSVDLKQIGDIIKQSLPYATLVFMMAIHTRIDTILVERIAGKDQAGIYAAGYRLLDVGNIFGLMFAGILLPLFGRMLAEKSDTAPIIRLSVNMLLPFSFIVSVIAACHGADIMEFLYNDAGIYDGQVFGWLMGAFPGFCMMYIFSTLLTANGNLRLLNKIAFAGVVLNIALNIWLIGRDKALGAAIATCLTQSMLAGCYIMATTHKFRLRIDGKWMAAHAGFILLSAATGYILDDMLPFGWMLRSVFTALVCFAYMFIFRFVSVASIKQLAAGR